MQLQQPTSKVLELCSSYDPFSRREHEEGQKKEGADRRHYAIQHILTKLGVRGWRLRELATGKRKLSQGWTHRYLETTILLTLRLGSLVELSEDEVHRCFLARFSPFLADPARSRPIHAQKLQGTRFRSASRLYYEQLENAMRACEWGYDQVANRMSVTDMQRPVRAMLEQLSTMGNEVSYTPEKFQKQLAELERKHKRRI